MKTYKELESTNMRTFNLDDVNIYIRRTSNKYDEYILFRETAHRDITESQYLTKQQIKDYYGIEL